MARKQTEAAEWRAGTGGGAGDAAVVAGTFHILQPGNLAAVRLAREACGRVCVVLERDDAGSPGDRPGISLAERAEMVAALKHVDAVAFFPAGGERAGLEGLRPYTWFACAGQADGPAGRAAAELADRREELPLLRGCFTPDILRAIRDGKTPVKLPRGPAWNDNLPAPAAVQPAPVLPIGHGSRVLRRR